MTEQLAVPIDAITAPPAPGPSKEVPGTQARVEEPPAENLLLKELSLGAGEVVKIALGTGWRSKDILDPAAAESVRKTINSLAAQDQALKPDQYPKARFDGQKFVCYGPDGKPLPEEQVFLDDTLATLRTIAESTDTRIPQVVKDTAKTQAAQLEQCAAEKAKVAPSAPEQTGEALTPQDLLDTFGIEAKDKEKLDELIQQLKDKKIATQQFEEQRKKLSEEGKSQEELLAITKKRREGAIKMAKFLNHDLTDAEMAVLRSYAPEQLQSYVLRLIGATGSPERQSLEEKIKGKAAGLDIIKIILGILLASSAPVQAMDQAMSEAMKGA